MKNQLSRALSLSTHHSPVLVKEVVGLLQCQPGKIIVDGTIGGGGHSCPILRSILPGGYLIGLDVDGDAIQRASEKLKSFGFGFSEHFRLYRENYKDVARILKEEHIEFIDGLLLDLGFSSEQIQDASRGFSFMRNGPLDMRYDTRRGENARDVINHESREKLSWIFHHFGEERKAHRIANLIVEERKKGSIETTQELSRIARRATFSTREKINPATRVFQALRIYINKELENLEMALIGAMRAVSQGGRICVVSYHSLEDRLVKNLFKEHSRAGRIKIITPHPVRPSREETDRNRRSRSAKLRVAEII